MCNVTAFLAALPGEALWEDASPGSAARNAVTLHMWDLLYWDEPDWEAKAG